MTSQEFWLSFLSNFLATLFAGTIIGTLLIWKINKSESVKENKRLEIDKKNYLENKAIKYLKIIKEEIKDIIVNVEVYINSINDSNFPIYIFLSIDYWEILKTSGEIPTIFEPTMIQILSIFYSRANEINEIDNRMALANMTRGHDYGNEFPNIIKEKLNSLLNINSSNSIILSIDQSIIKAQKSVIKLNKLKKKI
jgi:hypothetical protein